jgi:hypothetical protein
MGKVTNLSKTEMTKKRHDLMTQKLEPTNEGRDGL